MGVGTCDTVAQDASAAEGGVRGPAATKQAAAGDVRDAAAAKGDVAAAAAGDVQGPTAAKGDAGDVQDAGAAKGDLAAAAGGVQGPAAAQAAHPCRESFAGACLESFS